MKEIDEILEQIKNIQGRKSQDYASQGKDFENFERSEQIMSWFKNEFDKTFVWPISTKLSRLATLLNSDRPPNNESIEDSFLDLTTYCALWFAFYKRKNSTKTVPCIKCGKEVNFKHSIQFGFCSIECATFD